VWAHGTTIVKLTGYRNEIIRGNAAAPTKQNYTLPVQSPPKDTLKYLTKLYGAMNECTQFLPNGTPKREYLKTQLSWDHMSGPMSFWRVVMGPHNH
jgi:hypothetical protein